MTHGRWAFETGRCRCDVCHEAARVHWRAMGRRRRCSPIAPDAPPRELAPHATRACYARGCRQPLCIRAERAYQSARRRRTRAHTAPRFLDVAPLARLLVAHGRALGPDGLFARLGISRTALTKILSAGRLPEETAEVIAKRLGLHPANIWGHAFYQSETA